MSPLFQKTIPTSPLDGVTTAYQPTPAVHTQPETTTPRLVFPTINDHPIAMDECGRMSLNDLWVAAGSIETKRPAQWKRNDTTKKLETALGCANLHNPMVSSTLGTFACEELALDYAQFISIEFRVQCLQVLKDFNNGKLQQPQQPMSTGNPYLDTLVQMQLESNETRQELAEHTNQLLSLGSTVDAQQKRLDSVESHMASIPKQLTPDFVPPSMKTVSEIRISIGSRLSEAAIKSTIKANGSKVDSMDYVVMGERDLHVAMHYNRDQVIDCLNQLVSEARPIKEGSIIHYHAWTGNFHLKQH